MINFNAESVLCRIFLCGRSLYITHMRKICKNGTINLITYLGSVSSKVPELSKLE